MPQIKWKPFTAAKCCYIAKIKKKRQPQVIQCITIAMKNVTDIAWTLEDLKVNNVA